MIIIYFSHIMKSKSLLGFSVFFESHNRAVVKIERRGVKRVGRGLSGGNGVFHIIIVLNLVVL